MNNDYIENKECRMCQNKNMTSYLNLGNMPLVNKVLNPEDVATEKKYPLDVLLCNDCNLSQLSIVVSPKVLYRNYVYRSSISDSFKNHCTNLAEKLTSSYLNKGDLIVDIASNDGCMLKPFRDRGMKVLGVEPALNLAKIANEEGMETIPEFWSPNIAKDILKRYGPAKGITACNVFAHVHDVHSFLTGVETLLDDKGYFMIEAPHLYSLVEKTEFDTVYHEHLSYLLVKPVERVVRQHNLRLAKVEELDIHGGSLRFYIEKRDKRDTSDGSVEKMMAVEERAGLYNIGAYMGLRRQVNGLKNNLSTILGELKSLGKNISGFGASAKGNILLNYCGLNTKTIDYVYDDTPEKQNKLYPGVHIPIVSRDKLLERKPDYLMLLSWNFADEMMKKTKDYQGKYLIPVPHLKIV